MQLLRDQSSAPLQLFDTDLVERQFCDQGFDSLPPPLSLLWEILGLLDSNSLGLELLMIPILGVPFGLCDAPRRCGKFPRALFELGD